MVKAMLAEQERQLAATDVRDELGRSTGMHLRGVTPESMMEAVARAGLAAIKNPDQSVTRAMHDAAKLQFDLDQAYRLVANAMIDKILEPTATGSTPDVAGPASA